MKHIKIVRWIGVAGAVLVPALAVAALEIPNTFAAGQRVSAAEMNANFAALDAKVEELETRLNQHATNEAWIAPTLLNGWTNYGGRLTTAGFRKDGHGVVHLKGLLRPGTGSIVMTLPEGYRPAQARTVATEGWVNNSPHMVGFDLDSSGSVRRDSTGSSDTWISLDGISFHAGE